MSWSPRWLRYQTRSGNDTCRRPYVEALEARNLLAADVVISEIMYHQLGDDNRQEFVELQNVGTETAELNGWQFTTGIDFELPNVSLASGDFLVIAADVQAFTSLHPNISNVVGGWTGRLANRGENLTLSDNVGQVVDAVRYADEGDWAVRFLEGEDNGHRGWNWLAESDGDGKSLELVNATLSNDHGQNWSSSIPTGGTPGVENSMASTDTAPLIVGLAHSPIIPRSSEAVTISATILDEQLAGVEVSLSYRLNGAGNFVTIPMADNGVAPDLTASDRLYSANIPPQPDGSVVEFLVQATDATGQSRTVPTYLTDDPSRTANRLYQVIDAAPRVDEWDPQQTPLTYLIMVPAERNELRDIGDGPFLEGQSNSQMNGTFIRVDGNGTDLRYNVGIRNRGGASRVGPPNNYRVNVPHDAVFNGAVSLNLNSRTTHAQILGSSIYRLAGLPAAEAIPMQVRVNGIDLAESGGPDMYGYYTQLETITGSFPDRYFPDDRRGNLYRVIEVGTETGDLRYEGPEAAAYDDTYSKRTNEETNDWSDLIDLVDVLNNADEATFISEVERVLDVDQWLRYIALDALLGNLETGLNVGRGDNYWLYRGTIDTRFKLIPHDLDTILGRGGRTGQPNASIFGYTDTPGLQRLLTHEQIVPRYYQAFVELIEDVYNPEILFPLFDHLVGHLPDSELAEMKQFVTDRIEGVRRQLPEEFVVTSELPIVNGLHRTTLPAAELVGTADGLQTRSVLINGRLADWSPVTREWSIRLEEQGDSETLIALGDSWKYLDDGSNQVG